MKNNYKNNPIFLKTGFTTGACASAASVAALETLLKNEAVTAVQVELPNKETYSFECDIKDKSSNSVTASVIKDAGDDVDITDGIEVEATVELAESNKIELLAGEGIGICTKEGLAVKVGEPAINPVPKKNIIDNLKKTLEENNSNVGLKVSLCIPNGKELAKKTLNEKLGILNGLSILGTTGIVKPMSNEAIVKTIYYELKQVLSQNKDKAVVLVPGNYGKSYALQMGVDSDLIVQTSNFIGDSLDIAKELGFRKILLIGDLGKLVKVAGGIFQTHSKIADARMEILAANLAALNAPTKLVREVLDANTTSQVISMLEGSAFEEIYQVLVEKIKEKILKRNNFEVEVIMFSNSTGLLAKTIKDEDLKLFKK